MKHAGQHGGGREAEVPARGRRIARAAGSAGRRLGPRSATAAGPTA